MTWVNTPTESGVHCTEKIYIKIYCTVNESNVWPPAQNNFIPEPTALRNVSWDLEKKTLEKKRKFLGLQFWSPSNFPFFLLQKPGILGHRMTYLASAHLFRARFHSKRRGKIWIEVYIISTTRHCPTRRRSHIWFIWKEHHIKLETMVLAGFCTQKKKKFWGPSEWKSKKISFFLLKKNSKSQLTFGRACQNRDQIS
jgi:hypothetical protein